MTMPRRIGRGIGRLAHWPPPGSMALLALLAILSAGAAATTSSSPSPSSPSGTKPSQPTAADSGLASGPAWVEVDYGELLDRRRLSHSGESIEILLRKLQGRPLPPPGEHSADLQTYMLLDPLLETYAFILPDALDTLAVPPDPPMVEVGALWQPGEPQPGWAELLRSRRFLVESDGRGRFRAFLPLPSERLRSPSGNPSPSQSPDAKTAGPSALPSEDSAATAEQAWKSAWPVLRHVFAAERRRLSRLAGDRPEDHPLEVEVHSYAHLEAVSRFHLGVRPFRARVTDTRGPGESQPLDLAPFQSFLASGLQLEGGRLEADGRIRLLGSETAAKPSLLGRPMTLADLAVAYRAVFHGGLSEPYMSLDGWYSPQTAQVNYGGRLQDTRLGLVSLLSDVRFKTFSLGLDVLAGRDERGRIRQALSGFRTHIERFAADAKSKDTFGQQTRFWFYPDNVELTLSDEGDVLVMRRARMSAASERLQQQSRPGVSGERQEDPPWTRETIRDINLNYDALGRLFPELTDLDQVVRLLSLFTWLRQAGSEGLTLPDLDAFLAVDLPAQPTPRFFPMLLTYGALTGGGDSGSGSGARAALQEDPGRANVLVEMLDRAPVTEALDRLETPSGRPLPSQQRLRRVLSVLDRRVSDQAALAKEIESSKLDALDDSSLDQLTKRAERLWMHHLSISGIPATERDAIRARQAGGGSPRVISVSIGGVDLGMGQAMARASHRHQRLSWGGMASAIPTASPSRIGSGETASRQGSIAAATGAARGVSADSAGMPAAARGVAGAIPPPPGERGAASGDSPLLPAVELPDHGWPVPGSGGGNTPEGGTSARQPGNSSIKKEPAPGAPSLSSIFSVLGVDSPDVRSRRLVLDPSGTTKIVERVEDLRLMRYRLERQGWVLSARLEPLPHDSQSLASGAPAGAGPGQVLLDQVPPPPAGLLTLQAAPADASKVVLRLRGLAGAEIKDLAAGVPRPLIWRLLLGRDTDPTPGQPLRGLDPLPPSLEQTRRMMVYLNQAQRQAPWDGAASADPIPAEEDPVRLAAALKRWWNTNAAGRSAPSVVVGTNPAESAARWEKAPAPGKDALLLLPEDGFPGLAEPVKQELEQVWKASKDRGLASSLPEGSKVPSMVLLVTAESSGRLGARLRQLSRDPALKGKLLAVWSLGGRVREDLPASLLAEGNLAALGIAELPPVGLPKTASQLSALAGALASSTGVTLRVEDLPGPLLWYF